MGSTCKGVGPMPPKRVPDPISPPLSIGDRTALPFELGAVVDAYITRRLHALCRMVSGCDAPNCVMTNFDSKIQALNHITQRAGITFVSEDLEPQRKLHAWSAKQLTPRQAQQMVHWYNTSAGSWFSQAIMADRSRDWRKTPAIYLGDSGSVNKTKAAPSTVRLLRAQLRDHSTDDRVASGATVTEYRQMLECVVAAFREDCFTHSDVDTLTRVMCTSTTRAASSVKLVESLNSFTGTTVERRPGACIPR